MSNELTDVRCPCGAEFQADSYDAGFIAGSGMCQNCDAALPPKDICTCPSGDGSLRHPCPAHPAPVEQAGGDERDLQGAQGERDGWGPFPIVQVPWNVFDRAVMWVEDRRRYGDDGTIVDDWKALKTIQRAALAQPSLMPPDRGPWHAVKWDGGRRVDLSSDDFEHDVALTVSGDFVEGDKFRYAQELAAWMNAHLAQPSPVQAEQHWPKLEKPAQVGGVRFSAGVSSRLVVEAAQRLYEFESTPEQEAERIERLQAFREQLDPLNLAPHAEAFNEAPAEALKPEQAEAERPEVVAVVRAQGFGRVCEADANTLYQHCSDGDELMTVAQHERIVKAWIERWKAYIELSAKIAAQRDAANARLHEVATACATAEQERDAALARVAELERKLRDEENAHTTTIEQRDNAEHWADQLAKAIAERFGVDIGEHSNLNCPWNEALVWMQQPPAQAQHSVLELEQSRSALTEAQMRRIYENSTEAENERLGFAAFARLMRRAEAVHQIAAAPGKEVVHE